MKFRPVHILISIACVALLFNCSSSDKVTNSPNAGITLDSYSFVSFDLASGDPGKIPLPNEVLRNPVTGLLNFPTFGSPAVDALIAQVNTLDGFSTSSGLRMPFVGGLDADSVNNSTLLLVDLVDLALAQGGLPVNPFKELTFEVTTDDEGNSLVKALPVRPLQPGRTHMVIITQGVMGDDGDPDTIDHPVEPDTAMLALKGTASLVGGPAEALEPLRQLYDTQLWPAAEAIVGTDRLFIPAMWVFTTQTQFQGLSTMYAKAQAENPVPDIAAGAVGADAVDGLFNLAGLGAAPHDAIGAVYTGSFNAPMYISNQVTGWIQSFDNPTRNDINFIATLPQGPGPFPVIIYQHGLTSNKETVLALANTAALGGFGTIAIDLVQHGERAIDADGDGVIDSSGATYLNVQNLLLGRDNGRQSAGDLMMLSRMISSGATDFNGDGAPEFAPNAVGFVGISMGAIVGTTFTAIDPNVNAININVGGGRLVTNLQTSGAFGPPILAGLAAFGLEPGTVLFDLFTMFGQAIIDDSDPFNYGAHLTSGDLAGGQPKSLLFQEMIGDQVVSNTMNRDLARSFNVAQVQAIEEISGLAQENAPHFGSGYWQFESPADGFTAHSALLSPAGGNPTAAIQLQSLTFIGSAMLGTPTVVDPYNAAKKGQLGQDYPGFDNTVDVSKLNFFPGYPEGL